MTNVATETRSIVVERDMTHPPEKIWRALTQSALIEEWLMKNDFQPIVGHKFNFRAQPVMGWNGVTDCEASERFDRPDNGGAVPRGAATKAPRGDAFDPSQNPGAPGAPRPLGSRPPAAKGPVQTF
jgi:hypothetical protein